MVKKRKERVFFDKMSLTDRKEPYSSHVKKIVASFLPSHPISQKNGFLKINCIFLPSFSFFFFLLFAAMGAVGADLSGLATLPAAPPSSPPELVMTGVLSMSSSLSDAFSVLSARGMEELPGREDARELPELVDVSKKVVLALLENLELPLLLRSFLILGGATGFLVLVPFVELPGLLRFSELCARTGIT